MRILLIRHGETNANKDGRFQGASNSTLNSKGLSQAEALGVRLKSEEISAIYSSPQTRAMETAWPIAEAHGLDINTIDGLRELDIGELDRLKG